MLPLTWTCWFTNRIMPYNADADGMLVTDIGLVTIDLPVLGMTELEFTMECAVAAGEQGHILVGVAPPHWLTAARIGNGVFPRASFREPIGGVCGVFLDGTSVGNGRVHDAVCMADVPEHATVLITRNGREVTVGVQTDGKEHVGVFKIADGDNRVFVRMWHADALLRIVMVRCAQAPWAE